VVAMRKFSSVLGLMATTSKPLELQILIYYTDNKSCYIQDHGKKCRDYKKLSLKNLKNIDMI
jgi:hypothetical protein